MQKAPRHHAEVPGAGGDSVLVDKLVVLEPADGQACALTVVGERKEGVVHAQRQHTVDVQGGLTELGAEHDGVHTLSLQDRKSTRLNSSH